MNRFRLKAIVLASAVLATAACGALSAEDRPSARISSLGGVIVSGIIPDFYTDLSINPAYACFADRLTIDFGRRNTTRFDMAFPFLKQDTYYSDASSTANGTNELSLYGLRSRGWGLALSAQWQLNGTERSDTRSQVEVYSESRYYAERTYLSGDEDFGRIGVAAARRLGDGAAVGLLFQGRVGYDSGSDASLQEYEYYDLPYSPLIPYQSASRRYADSHLGRELSFELQAGILKGAPGLGTEIVLAAGYRAIEHEQQSYEHRINRWYDTAGQIDDYESRLLTWDDKRTGDVWNYGLSMLHTFPGGIRLYSGGALSLGFFDGSWEDATRVVDWDSGNNSASAGFKDDGSMWEASYFLKGGKKFALHNTLDLFCGLSGWFQRTHAQEAPVIRYAQSIDGGDTTAIDQPSTFRATRTAVNLYLPLSIEFRPSSFFSCWAGVTLYGKWSKDVIEHPALAPFIYARPHLDVVPGAAARSAAREAVVYPETSITDWRRDWSSGDTMTLGFSLHYRDRFFFDVYTDAELIPSYLENKVIDVRYAF